MRPAEHTGVQRTAGTNPDSRATRIVRSPHAPTARRPAPAPLHRLPP
ncbi:hypothetical protein [Lysobacter gummosus]